MKSVVCREPRSYLLAAGEAAGLVEAGGDGCCAGCCVASGVGVAVAVGALSGAVSSTERSPVNEGSANIKAISMNAPAATIVTFANKLAVPRGPNAVLDRELEKSAPASALPGCNRMTTIKTTHAKMKSEYKTIDTKANSVLCT